MTDTTPAGVGVFTNPETGEVRPAAPEVITAIRDELHYAFELDEQLDRLERMVADVRAERANQLHRAAELIPERGFGIVVDGFLVERVKGRAAARAVNTDAIHEHAKILPPGLRPRRMARIDETLLTEEQLEQADRASGLTYPTVAEVTKRHIQLAMIGLTPAALLHLPAEPTDVAKFTALLGKDTE